MQIDIVKHEHGHSPLRIEIHGGKGIPIKEFEIIKQKINESLDTHNQEVNKA